MTISYFIKEIYRLKYACHSAYKCTCILCTRWAADKGEDFRIKCDILFACQSLQIFLQYIFHVTYSEITPISCVNQPMNLSYFTEKLC